jgi:hypothetical protein
MLHTIASPHARALPLLTAAGLALVLALPPPAAAQNPDKTAPPSGRNPADPRPGSTKSPPPTSRGLGRFLVGDAAPDVQLNDHAGRPFHLTVERQSKPWLLVFVRRPETLAEVERGADGLAALGLGAAIVAPFGRDKVLEWVPAPKLPVLFDRASQTARIYGVYDPVTGNPRPGAFLVDRRGRIVWLISGGLPSGTELVRMTREALEAQERDAAPAEGSAN